MCFLSVQAEVPGIRLGFRDFGLALSEEAVLKLSTLPETNMETQQGPNEDYSPSKRGLYEL